MKQLKIAIAGAGGVGGFIGAKLIVNGYDVTLVARGSHFDAVKQNGLKVIDNKEQFTVNPKVVNSLDDAIYDVIFITTKSYDFKSACESIKGGIGDETLIIPIANGVDHKSELKKYLDKGILCDGTIYIISNIQKAGVIKRKSDTFYLIFGCDTKDERLTLLEDILNKSGLRSKYSSNIQYDCWKKYLFISSFASLTSYFKQPMGYIIEKELDLLLSVLKEIKKVAIAMDIPLSDTDIQKCIDQAKNVPYDSKTSMQLDFEKDHKTELEPLCGYVVKQGESLGISVDKMRKIYYNLS